MVCVSLGRGSRVNGLCQSRKGGGQGEWSVVSA